MKQCRINEIIHGTKVQSVEELGRGILLTTSDQLQFETKSVLVATNGFATQLLPNLAVKPARNQVLVTEAIEGLPFRGCFHIDEGYYYFRSVQTEQESKTRILIGGGRNLSPKAEETTQFGYTALIQNKLESLLREVIYPQKALGIEYRWSGILGIGPTKQPIIQRVSENLYCAVRLGGMGVAIGSLTGEKAAELVLKSL